MNTNKQANLLMHALSESLVDGEAVVAWVDRLIQESSVTEDWMIELSIHRSDDHDGIEALLGTYSDFEFIGSFFEYVALLGCLHTLKGLPIFKVYPAITIMKDSIDIEPSDTASLAVRAKVQEMEATLELGSYDEVSTIFASESLAELVSQTQLKHPEIVSFIRDIA